MRPSRINDSRNRHYEVVYLSDTGANPLKIVIACDELLNPEQAFGLLRQIRRNPATGEPINIRKVLSVDVVSAPGLAATA
ncbi:MAG TPA: hypothetical protein VFA65_17960 [Bryobacteraceae bacterium]|nr:hypothetical protein [Bryobacteraceae bacterium]